MKKALYLAAACILSLAVAGPVSAEKQTAAAYEVTNGENFCTGTFESVPTGALPQKGTNQELGTTQGWRSNEYDYQTVSVVDKKGYQGGKCLQIEGNGKNAYGAAYYIFPTGKIQRSETYEVSFLYKVTDPLTKTNQLHCDVMDGGVGETHTIIAGLAPLPGEDMGDGWRKVSGTFVVESPGTFKAIRFFAEFNYNGKVLGSEANLLIDNVEIAKQGMKAGASKAVELSSKNLVKGGDFEYKKLNSLYDPGFDANGWWTVDGDKMASTVVKDGGSQVLRIAGNKMLNYGSVYVNFQQKMKAGITYRLLFDYKFLGSTRSDSLQAHVSFMADADRMVGNTGGWNNVNLIKNDIGETLPNGYKRAIVDYTPSAFEADAIYGLRIFIKLAQQDANFGMLIDNVRVSEVLEDANTDTTTSSPPQSGGKTTISPPAGEAEKPDVGTVPAGEETTEPSSEEGSTTALGETTQSASSTGSTVAQTVPVGNDADMENPPSAGFPWIPVIIVAVVVLAGGGVALWYFVIRPRIGTPPDGQEPPTQGS